METKDILVIGKDLDIVSDRFDKFNKVDVIKLSEKDIKSEADFIKALEKSITNLDNGTYSIHHDGSLFARFDINNKQLTKVHKWSENTGVIMPCWNYFNK